MKKKKKNERTNNERERSCANEKARNDLMIAQLGSRATHAAPPRSENRITEGA